MTEEYIDNNSMNLWLVTQPDGGHYIMFSTAIMPPQRGKVEDSDTHETFDAWEVENCVSILPVSNKELPHYLCNHSWDDEPMAMAVSFFPIDNHYINCQQFTDFERCWRYNFSKSLLACSRCIFSNCKKLKSYKDRHQKSEPTQDFKVAPPNTNSL